jgi:hypothetical protein
MSKTSLAVDCSQLDNVKYDVQSMAENIAVSITIPDSVNNQPSKYNKQDRLKAVSIFIVVGKIRETARLCGMPYDTLFSWTQSNWWADCINQGQSINTSLINARTSNIINKAFDNVEERLDKGDYATYDKDKGKVVLRPVSAKDSAVIFGVMYDKQRINNSLATSITQSTTTHLIDIKGQFDAMSQPKVIEHELE